MIAFTLLVMQLVISSFPQTANPPVVPLLEERTVDNDNCLTTSAFRAYGGSGPSATHDTYTYHGIGNNILITEQDSDGTVTIRSNITTENDVHDMAIVHDRLYVLREDGIDVYSIAAPLNPQLQSQYNATWSSYAKAFAVQEHYAYVAAREDGLVIIDFSNMTTPTAIGSCRTPGMAVAVRVTTTHAYLAVGDRGIRIINITDPTNPHEISSIQGGLNITDLAIDDTYLYTTVRTGDPPFTRQYLHIYDITGTPTRLAAYELSLPGDYRAIDARDNIIAIGASTAGLLLFDTTNKSNPVPIATMDGINEWSMAKAYIYISGEVITIANFGGIRSIDIHDPSMPQERWRLRTAAFPNDIAIDGQYLYLADHSTLSVQQRSGNTFADVLVLNDMIYAFAITPTALIGLDNYNQIKIYTGHGTDLHRVNAFDIGYRARYIAAEDTTIYTITPQDTLRIYTIQEDTTLQQQAEYEGLRSARALALHDHTAYVAAAGLTILDVSTPTQPLLKQQLCTTCYGEDIVIDNGLVYLLCENDGLTIITPTPQGGTVTATLPILGGRALAIEHGYAYIQTSYGDIAIADITDPLHPTLAYTTHIRRFLSGLAVRNKEIFSIDPQCGIELYDATACLPTPHNRPVEHP